MANLTATTITGNLDVTGGGVISGDGSGLSGVDPFAAGTKMVFYQASAPTGWTQDTASALSNTVMSVVTGTGGGTGGSTSYFSSFLATTNKTATDTASVTGSVSGTVGNHTLSTPQIPSHNHAADVRNSNEGGPAQNPGRGYVSTAQGTTGNSGGGGSHAHPFSGNLSGATASVSATVPAANVKYANVIIATKD